MGKYTPYLSHGNKKNRRGNKRWAALAVILTAAVCVPCFPTIAADGDEMTKEEVVYSSLAADGQVKEIYVVNAFNLSKRGVITDYGEYSLLENLTDTQKIGYEGSKVSLSAEKGRAYYQGNMVSKDLPWDIQIKYTLDGKMVRASELAGASGNVGITISTAPNSKVDKIFFEKYMLQVTVTLDTDICQNIQAEGATLANAGSDKQVTFTVMPGTEGKMEVNTDAEIFAMKGISIAAVPFSASADMLDVTEIDQLTKGLNQLSEGILELDDGAKQLKEGAVALQDGTGELKSGVDVFHNGILQLKEGAGNISNGAALLESGSVEFQNGLNQAALVSDEFVEGSGQIQDAMLLLKAGTTWLGSLDLAQLQMLPEGLNGLADGLAEMQAGYDGLFQVLDNTMEANPISEISQEEIDAVKLELAGTSPEMQAVFGKLAGNYTSAMRIVGTYNGIKQNFVQLQEGLASLIQNIRGMAGQLEAMKSVDPEGLKELAAGIAGLADQYVGFHEGLCEYMTGIKGLSSGYSGIDSGIRGLAEGTSGLYGGINQTADGASGLLNGVGSLDSGAKELSEGVGALAGGLDILNAKTEKMPAQIRESIDNMIGKYTNTDFEPISFTSSKNKNVESVQFVLSTEGIEKAEVAKEKTEKEKEEGVWEKFLQLFE